MKFKKLLVLIAALVALGALAVFKQVAGPKEKPSELSEGTAVSPSFDTASVKRVDIHRGESDRLLFVKDDAGDWKLDSRFGTRVRKESLEPLLSQLAALRGELRAEDKQLFGDFSLTEEKAFQFEIYGSADQKLAHVFLSPQRPRGTQNFVRAFGSDRVFVTDTDLLASLGIFSEQDRLQERVFAEDSAPSA